MSVTAPLVFVNDVNAADGQKLTIHYGPYGKWVKIETDVITVLFPAGGKKPMFIWWHTNDTSNIYVVKYKGLIEYITLDYDYYRLACEANALTVRERLMAKYASSGPHQARIRERIQNSYLGWLLGFHPALLPFSACRWNLTGPVSVTREDGVSYLAFNFTLAKAPPKFDFAEGNVIIRCRFYATDATENVHGLYNYTVKAGELKMDLIIKNWKWNIDKLNDLFEYLEGLGYTVPKLKAGLALWVDMASINVTKLSTAEQDVETAPSTLPESVANAPLEPVEQNSVVSDIIAGGQRIQVRNKISNEATALNVRNRLHERFKLRFAKESQTLAGFFDFVNTAVVINSTTGEPSVVNVTAAYMQAGSHLRLFIGYPYFGSGILEHDPSIGVEQAIPILPKLLLWVLVGATVVIGVAVAAVKLLKKPVNILAVR
ncbi:MAG: hypothetical protein N0A00_10135 [Candidatus Bathyarchaeota archaeon]|nr:hypothetical protein [Candidatus Bathyarchaeota archaeon]